ncbi:MAG: 4Fe-4S double cluster binding domain-containing protein [Lentisphaeria bacterium]|nr:4Fe-4S double cluster binding domain-containing protein [Lentisphaeria bacterium]NLZ61059.1 hypothetical protein [Lentisphaerota bacterium]
MPDLHRQFYTDLARHCGAVQIACLHPSLALEASLQDQLQASLSSEYTSALPYLQRQSKVLQSPFSSRAWAHSLLLISFQAKAREQLPFAGLPAARPGRPTASLAAYILHEDYHQVGARILAKLAELLDLQEYEFGVDSSPLLEKALARHAGLGRYGYNCLLRCQGYGSRLHLGFLFASKQLPAQSYEARLEPDCADCRLCLQSCPNAAISESGILRIQRCRSYLANEKKGALSWQEQLWLGGSLAGCSLCSYCCPDDLAPRPKDLLLDAEALCMMPSAQLKALIQGSILQHQGVSRLKRNAAAALAIQLPPEEAEDMQQKLLESNHSPALRQTVAAWQRQSAKG